MFNKYLTNVTSLCTYHTTSTCCSTGLYKKKSLKIPKGQSEFIYQRRTDNTLAKRKIQKDKQGSTKHTHKPKDPVTRTPLETGGELW